MQAADGGSADHDAITAAAWISFAAASGPGMKPLTKSQREAAVAIVRKDPSLKSTLQGRATVLFVEPNLTGRGDEHSGQAVVGIHDHEQGRSIVAVVDPESESIVGVEDLPAQLQLGTDERSDANALALADERVREFVGDRDPDPLTRLYFPPAGDRSHRYAIVFVRPDASARLYAVVDLTTGEVTEVLDHLASGSPHGI
jgi:hypothetical protein